MLLNNFVAKLTPSDIVQICGIVASFTTSLTAIIISLISLRQNSKMIEESSRAVISIYSETINTGTPMLFIVIKNFGHSPAVITKFDYDYDLADCYNFRAPRDYLKDLIGSTLAPNQSRICNLDYTKLMQPITFTLEYESVHKKYKDSFTIDLKAAAGMPVSKTASSGKELKAISFTLQEMLQKNL